MPLFEYICQACGEISEQLVTGSRKPSCPNCGSRKLAKQLSGFSIRATPASVSLPPCGTSSCPTRGCGCSGGGCPYSG